MKSLIYRLLRISNDINAVKKRRIGKRVKRRIAGKLFGKIMRWL